MFNDTNELNHKQIKSENHLKDLHKAADLSQKSLMMINKNVEEEKMLSKP